MMQDHVWLISRTKWPLEPLMLSKKQDVSVFKDEECSTITCHICSPTHGHTVSCYSYLLTGNSAAVSTRDSSPFHMQILLPLATCLSRIIKSLNGLLICEIFPYGIWIYLTMTGIVKKAKCPVVRQDFQGKKNAGKKKGGVWGWRARCVSIVEST